MAKWSQVDWKANVTSPFASRLDAITAANVFKLTYRLK
jgi:hypothetical protein